MTEVIEINTPEIKIDIMLPACMAILNKGFMTMERISERIPETEKEISELTEKLADSRAKLEWLKSLDETGIKEIRDNYDDKIKYVITKLREDGRDVEADYLSTGLDENIILEEEQS